MRAGRLKHRVSFERSTKSTDSLGQSTDLWAEVASQWAGIEPLSSKELVTAQQETSHSSIRIITRYSSDVSGLTSGDRIVHGSVIYDIEGAPVNKNTSNVELVFMCKVHDGR